MFKSSIFGKVYCNIVKYILIICSVIAVSSCLQCYNCRGITNYDPNGCFNPSSATTYIQECAANEVCEKRVTQVDRLQDVIDRGCSPNCKGGQFVWTDEFQVYCCTDKSLCNSGRGLKPGFSILAVVLCTIFCRVFLL